MAENNKWKGIQTNFCLFQGEIIKDPQLTGGYAFLTLRTSYVQRDKAGQFTEVQQDIPLMVEPDGPISVVERFVKTGRKLQAWCHFKTWNSQGNNHHAFVARKIDLGDKPYEAPTGSNGAPPLPGQ